MEIKDWLIVGGLALAYLNREKLKEALNPASDKNAAYQAVTTITGGDPGAKAAAAVERITDPESKYRSLPHKYDMAAGVSYAQMNGQWVVDPYDTARLKADLKNKPKSSGVSVRRVGNSNQWEKLVSGKWVSFTAADYNTYRAIVGPAAGPAASVLLPGVATKTTAPGLSPWLF